MRSQQLLELNQSQQLVLNQQQYQSLRLLQYSAAELASAIDKAIADNPLLEKPDFTSAQEQHLDRYWSAYSVGQNNDDIPETADTPDLVAYLFEQLRMSRQNQQQSQLIAILIGELDEQGYLSPDIDWQSLNDSFGLQVSEADWFSALTSLQSFEPKGIGARGLAESLKLQLLDRAQEFEPDNYKLASDLIDYLPDVAAGRWVKLADTLACSKEDLFKAYELIQHLDPRPVANWDQQQINYIVPDVLFYFESNHWQVSLNPYLTYSVRLNQELMRQIKNTKLSDSMQVKVQEAKNFVRNIEQRGATILRVAQFLAKHQQDYLANGMAHLKPLRLFDVATKLDLHISTISRATRLKYAETPWGLIELKRMFSGVATAKNTDISAYAVRQKIKDLLAQEPHEKPYSDAQLVSLLKADGVEIARRTVAKHREAMGIKSSYLRKILA